MTDPSWLHGWTGLLYGYAAIQGPMLAGLVRSRAPLRQMLASPLVAMPLTVATGAALAAVGPLTASLAGPGVALSAAVAGTAAVGFGAGRVLGRRAMPQALYQRGARV